MSDNSKSQLLDLTVEITASYVANNQVPPAELPALIQSIHQALGGVNAPAEAPSAPMIPAVALKRSVTEGYLICLEDGRKFKSLKRHLRAKYNLSPAEYRAKWGLPKDYPMVAPAYAAARSSLAKALGLGQGVRPTGAKARAHQADAAE